MEAINDNNFEEQTKDGLVLVDFWAEWCGPCKMLTPVLAEIEQEMGADVKIVKLNVDENQNTAMKLSVASIPTMIVYKNGEIVDRHVGFLPKPQLKNLLQNHV